MCPTNNVNTLVHSVARLCKQVVSCVQWQTLNGSLTSLDCSHGFRSCPTSPTEPSGPGTTWTSCAAATPRPLTASTQIRYRGSSDVAILFRAGTIFSRIALLTNSRKAVIDRAGPIKIAAILSTGPRDTISNTAKALYPPAIAAIIALILLHQVKMARVREWRSKKRIGLATAEDTGLVQRLRKIKDSNRFILTPLVLGGHGWRNETIPVLHGPLPAWKLTCLADYTIRDVLTVIQGSYGRQLIPAMVRPRIIT